MISIFLNETITWVVRFCSGRPCLCADMTIKLGRVLSTVANSPHPISFHKLCLNFGNNFVEIQCGEPERGDGMTVAVSSRGVGGVATYRCDPGRNMTGNGTRVCLTKGSWTGKIPKCIGK